MIPDFNEHGYLPEGVHRAILDEISDRFGRQSEVRRGEFRWNRSGGLRRLCERQV